MQPAIAGFHDHNPLPLREHLGLLTCSHGVNTLPLIMLTKVDDVITQLGGTAKVAEMLGVGVTAVLNFKARGYIPPRWHLLISQEAARRKLAVSPELFGMVQRQAGASQ
jgi:hypothetical protein